MLLDESTWENPHFTIIGGVIAFCAILILTTMSMLCCLGQSREKRTSAAQRYRKASNSGVTSEEYNASDTIRSLQFSPNPAYDNPLRQTDPVRYTTAKAKEDEAEEDARYIYVDKEAQESDLEYVNPAEIEKQIQSASPHKQSIPSSLPAATWNHVPGQQDDQNHSDEDEEGYVTYNPDKSPIDLQGLPEDSQIYQNTIRGDQSLVPERHGYVNDAQVTMEMTTDDPVQRSDNSQYVNDSNQRDRTDSHHSYVNDIESIVREAKQIEEMEKQDSNVYVNNLDELVKAAKAKEARAKEASIPKVDGHAQNGSERDDRQNMYINDLFDVVQKAIYNEDVSTEDNQQLPESLYVNDLPHLYANSQKKSHAI